jgi:hypothetical protein
MKICSAMFTLLQTARQRYCKAVRQTSAILYYKHAKECSPMRQTQKFISETVNRDNMADDTAHTLMSQDKTQIEELKCSDYICVQCIELENKLRNALDELKSARLIIELLQHESSSSLTSKLTITGGSDILHETSNHHTNNEWVKVNHKRQETFIKDNQQKRKKPIPGQVGIYCQQIPSKSWMWSVVTRAMELTQLYTKKWLITIYVIISIVRVWMSSTSRKNS